MFGKNGRGAPHLSEMLIRSNANLKRAGEEVTVRLDHTILPPDCIVVVGECDRVLESADEIDLLAANIEHGMKPQTKKPSEWVLTLTGNMADWDPKKREVVLAALRQAGVHNGEIVSVKQGSIKLTLQLSSEEAERLFWAYHSGQIDSIGAIDLEYTPSPESTSSQLFADDIPNIAQHVSEPVGSVHSSENKNKTSKYPSWGKKSAIVTHKVGPSRAESEIRAQLPTVFPGLPSLASWRRKTPPPQQLIPDPGLGTYTIEARTLPSTLRHEVRTVAREIEFMEDRIRQETIQRTMWTTFAGFLDDFVFRVTDEPQIIPTELWALVQYRVDEAAFDADQAMSVHNLLSTHSSYSARWAELHFLITMCALTHANMLQYNNAIRMLDISRLLYSHDLKFQRIRRSDG